MKRTILLSTLLLSFIITSAQISFNTGSVELDKDLATINAKAKLNIKGFTIDLSTSKKIPIPKIEELLKIMEPAEIVLAKDIADIVHQPIDDVVTTYKANQDKGWGQIAKEMGIKPGSPEFHALKGKTKKNKDKGGGNGKGKGNKGKGNSGKAKGKKK